MCRANVININAEMPLTLPVHGLLPINQGKPFFATVLWWLFCLYAAAYLSHNFIDTFIVAVIYGQMHVCIVHHRIVENCYIIIKPAYDINNRREFQEEKKIKCSMVHKLTKPPKSSTISETLHFVEKYPHGHTNSSICKRYHGFGLGMLLHSNLTRYFN